MSAAHVIVGASLAGAKAAETLREEGFGGPIVLIGEETERPYERPPLSKDYLLGKAERDTIYVHPQTGTPSTTSTCAWAPSHRRRPAAREVRWPTAAGSATPSCCWPPARRRGGCRCRAATRTACSTCAGGRQRPDQDALQTATRVVVIGAGWIGLETAAAARAAGVDVTILETAELPLLRVLGREVAQSSGLHRDTGSTCASASRCGDHRTGGGPTAFGWPTAATSRPTRSSSASGSRQQPARRGGPGGRQRHRGRCRAAFLDPDIYAAGDVANAYHPLLGRHVRVEHWANALHQPQVAARAMLGQDVAYDLVPYFYTDQYDLGMEYAGYVEPGGYDQVVFRGDVDRREFVAFWLAAGGCWPG